MGAGEMNAQPNAPGTFRKVSKCVSTLKFLTTSLDLSSNEQVCVAACMVNFQLSCKSHNAGL